MQHFPHIQLNLLHCTCKLCLHICGALQVICVGHLLKFVFRLQVPEVINTIRQMSKAALKEDAKPKPEADESFYNSQKFEVLYCGKVTVAQKKVPSTLIDDCIEKFRQHEAERKRLRPTNGQRCPADTHVELLELEGDPLMSPSGDEKAYLESFREEEGSEGVNDLGRLGRVGLPECILEDSGFEEQEVRTRCNSLAAGLQHRPREVGGKVAARRRHASAPSHVQPSNAETNCTMLFQVTSPDTSSRNCSVCLTVYSSICLSVSDRLSLSV